MKMDLNNLVFCRPTVYNSSYCWVLILLLERINQQTNHKQSLDF